MAGIGIITNPHSKLNKRNPRRQQLLGYIAGERGHVEITNSLEDLKRVAETFHKRKIAILAINGGDGTISRTLTAFIETYGQDKLPMVALLRGGTINVLASNLGIKGSPEKILFRLMEEQSTSNFGQCIKLRSIEVEGNYGFLFANGTSVRFLEAFYKNKTNSLGSFFMLCRLAFSRFIGKSFYNSIVRTEPVSLTADDGKTVNHESTSVLCATIEKMPLGPPIFFGNRQKNDGFDCISFLMKAKDAWWRAPFEVIFNAAKQSSAKLMLHCQKLKLKTKEPSPYTLDGEIYYPKENNLQINLGPEIEFVIV